MNVIDTLNLLLKTSRDGQEGFRQCAAELQSAELRQVMSDRADECAGAAEELKDLISDLGGDPEDATSIPGDLHRGWLIAKGALTGHGDHAILDECERGEDTALRDYRMALEQDLPDHVRLVVEQQLQGVQHNHDQVKALRDRLASEDGADGNRSERRMAHAAERPRKGATTERLMHWSLAQARLHPVRYVGVAALIGYVGWHALTRRTSVLSRLTHRLR